MIAGSAFGQNNLNLIDYSQPTYTQISTFLNNAETLDLIRVRPLEGTNFFFSSGDNPHVKQWDRTNFQDNSTSYKQTISISGKGVALMVKLNSTEKKLISGSIANLGVKIIDYGTGSVLHGIGTPGSNQIMSGAYLRFTDFFVITALISERMALNVDSSPDSSYLHTHLIPPGSISQKYETKQIWGDNVLIIGGKA